MIEVRKSRDRRGGPRRGLLGSAIALTATAGAVLVAQPAMAADLTAYNVTLTAGPLNIKALFHNTTPSGAAADLGSFIAYADGPDADTAPDAQCTAVTSDNGATDPSCYITGLTAGAQYTVTTVARNVANTADLTNAVANPLSGTSTPLKLAAPASVSATANGKSGEVDVTWSPGNNTNAQVTNFTATAYLGTNSTGKSCTSTNGSVYACTVTGLADGTPYTFKVVANGTDPASKSLATASGSATPGVAPAAPTNVLAGTDSSGAVTVSWMPSATADATYTVTAYKDGVVETGEVDCSAGAAAGDSAITCLGTGIVAGSQYTFKVKATLNGLSSATVTSPAIVLVTAPGVPTAVAASDGDTQTVVTWTAPTTGTVANYRVLLTGGGNTRSCVTTSTTCTITGLTNGVTYTATVEAINSLGSSSGPSASDTATPVAPAKPTAPTVTAPAPADITANTAVVTWTAAAPVQGAAVTYYTVTATPKTTSSAASAQDAAGSSDDAAAAAGAVSCTVAAPATSCTLVGLQPGTAYDVTVKAYVSATVFSTAATTTLTTKAGATPGAGGSAGSMSGPIVTNRDGNSQMFARGGDNYLYTSVRDSSGNWGAWTSLGGVITGDPVAVSTGTGATARLVVFALGGADHAVWYRAQDATGTGFGPWTHVSGSKWISRIDVQKNASGTVQVFGRGVDGMLYYSVQGTATDPTSWQTWVSLGGIIASEPTVVQWSDGTLEVFAIGAGDGMVWHTKQSKAGDNTSWVWWSHVSPAAAQNVSL